jgi:hypothetical protein
VSVSFSTETSGPLFIAVVDSRHYSFSEVYLMDTTFWLLTVLLSSVI